MQSHELLREVIQQAGAKHVAAELGVSLSLVYKWTEASQADSGSGSANPLDRLEALLKCTNDPRLVQWLCERNNGFFVRNAPADGAPPENLIPATNEIVKEFADLLQVIATAAADNRITREESLSIRDRWEELKGVTETFVRCCEQGNFRPLKLPVPGAAPAVKQRGH
ncbi:MAG: phage regulatory CII family protein [Verrucomicrobiota bacterium]